MQSWRPSILLLKVALLSCCFPSHIAERPENIVERQEKEEKEGKGEGFFWGGDAPEKEGAQANGSAPGLPETDLEKTAGDEWADKFAENMVSELFPKGQVTPPTPNYAATRYAAQGPCPDTEPTVTQEWKYEVVVSYVYTCMNDEEAESSLSAPMRQIDYCMAPEHSGQTDSFKFRPTLHLDAPTHEKHGAKLKEIRWYARYDRSGEMPEMPEEKWHERHSTFEKRKEKWEEDLEAKKGDYFLQKISTPVSQDSTSEVEWNIFNPKLEEKADTIYGKGITKLECGPESGGGVQKAKHQPYLLQLVKGAWQIAVFSARIQIELKKPQESVACSAKDEFCFFDADDGECVDKDEDIVTCMEKDLDGRPQHCLKQDDVRIPENAFVASLVLFDDWCEGNGDEDEDRVCDLKKWRAGFGYDVKDTQHYIRSQVAVCQGEKKVFEHEDVKALKEYVKERKDRLQETQKKAWKRNKKHKAWAFWRHVGGEEDYLGKRYGKWLKHRIDFAKEIFKHGQSIMRARGVSDASAKRGLDRHAFVYGWVVANAAQYIERKTIGGQIEWPKQDDWFGPPRPRYWDAHGILAQLRSKYRMAKFFADYESPIEPQDYRDPVDITQKNMDREDRDVHVDPEKFLRFWLTSKAENLDFNQLSAYRKFLTSIFASGKEYGWNDGDGNFVGNLFRWAKGKGKKNMRGLGVQYLSLFQDEFPCEINRNAATLTAEGQLVVGVNTFPDQLQLLKDPLRDFPIQKPLKDFPIKAD